MSKILRPFKKMKQIAMIASFSVAFLSIGATAAQACSNPAGSAGDMMYNSSFNVMQFCDGTDWTAMKAGAGGGDTLAALSCNANEIAKWSGTVWACAVDTGASGGDDLGNHTATTALIMGTNKITGLGTPTAAADAATKAYVDAQISSGGADNLGNHTATTALIMGTNKITGLGTPTAAADAATKGYVDTAAAAAADNLGNHTATTTLAMGTNAITGTGNISGGTITGAALVATTSTGISWENGVNNITYNDGGGNVQIRFGNEFATSSHRFTHGGGAAWITSNIDATSNTAMTMQVSSNPGAGAGTAVTWGSALTITATDITFGGTSLLTGTGDDLGAGGSGDLITDGTIDSTEIENNTLTAADLAPDSVAASELANNAVASANIIDATIVEADLAASVGTPSNVANRLVKRNANGDFNARYINGTYMNMSHAVGTRNTDTVFYSSTDNYIRKNNAAGFRTALSVYSKAEVNALPGDNLGAGGSTAGTLYTTGGTVGRDAGDRTVYVNNARHDLYINGARRYRMYTTDIRPEANNGASLGVTGTRWNNIYMGGQLYSTGSAVAHTPLTVNGTKGGYGGINFRTGTTNYGTLMVNAAIQGFYNDTHNGWDWYFNNGVLTAGTVPGARIQANTITASQIATNGVAAAEIAAGAVGTSEVADNSLTATDLAANAVGASEIAAGAVGTSEIANGSVTATDLAANSVAGSEIVNGSIVATTELSATGTKNSITFLRGDNVWATPPGGGASCAGTPSQIGHTVSRNGGAHHVMATSNCDNANNFFGNPSLWQCQNGTWRKVSTGACANNGGK